MNKPVSILFLISLLFSGCSKSITEVKLTDAVSDELLQQDQTQITSALGEPKKKQKRTGGYSAYYFEDSEGSIVVVIFNEKNDAINIATVSHVAPNAVINRISKKEGWAEKEGLGFYPASVVYENTSGYVLYQSDSCTYLATTEKE